MFRREISRLLTKITQISHPVPSKDQLLDAIHKLDDEIGKVVKQTSALLMRDSSAEDVAVASQSMQSGFSDNTKSEIQRLQEMPGYSRLQKQVFYNLMTANKGSDDVNVRVNPAVDKFADNILIPHHNRFRSTRATSPDVQDNHSGSTSDLRYVHIISIFVINITFAKIISNIISIAYTISISHLELELSIKGKLSKDLKLKRYRSLLLSVMLQSSDSCT